MSPVPCGRQSVEVTVDAFGETGDVSTPSQVKEEAEGFTTSYAWVECFQPSETGLE